MEKPPKFTSAEEDFLMNKYETKVHAFVHDPAGCLRDLRYKLHDSGCDTADVASKTIEYLNDMGIQIHLGGEKVSNEDLSDYLSYDHDAEESITGLFNLLTQASYTGAEIDHYISLQDDHLSRVMREVFNQTYGQ